MATYKVLQDIEAEDKLLGPLTLRQFIYAIIVVVLGFIAFKIAVAVWWLAIPFLFPMALFGVLAAPFGHDQPSEVWLLARIRFALKPRKRIWDQSGMKELVTITAPKRIERQLTDNLTQTEVRSRLSALANTIDSRGWAVKNVNVNLFAVPSYAYSQTDSDRLVDPSMFPQEVPSFDVQAVDDMLDERNNPTAQHLTQMVNASAESRRQNLVQMMQTATTPTPQGQSTPPPDYWFMNGASGQSAQTQPGYTTFDHNPLVTPGTQQTPQAKGPTTADEAKLLDHIHHEKSHRRKALHGHEKTIDPQGAHPVAHPVSKQAAPAPPQTDVPTPVTPRPDPAILQLASNDDFSVATLARQANKMHEPSLPKEEVVISLH